MTEYILDLTAFDGETLDDGLREEIVRCRDCAYRDKEPDPPCIGPWEPERWVDWCKYMHKETKPDGFCHRGKRREGAES